MVKGRKTGRRRRSGKAPIRQKGDRRVYPAWVKRKYAGKIVPKRIPGGHTSLKDHRKVVRQWYALAKIKRNLAK